MGNIVVYRASAGSGKTYMLVYMYVKYLFVGQRGYILKKAHWIPDVHRSILAVTFTNKATIEMKERIMAALADMSQPVHPGGCKSQYETWLKTDVPDFNEMGSDRVSEVAGHLLADLLNDYTMFRVQTIDGFFQQVVRAFANDLNVDTGYKVELDGNAVVENSVDVMLGELDDPSNRDLLNWLTEFVNDRVNENSGWNPRADIIRLASYINSEKYRSYGQETVQQSDFRQCRDILVKAKMRYEEELKALCDEAKVILSSSDAYPDQFNKNAISCFDFLHMKKKKFQPTPSFVKSVENGRFLKSTVKKKDEYSETELHLADIGSKILDMCNEYTPKAVEYKTVCQILGNFYVLGILHRIQDYVKRYCRENNLMILSSTSDLIDKIIGDDIRNTPFIYEKVGVLTEHFMIDEFQDTSKLQWKNFVPLIAETASKGAESMIVGDVKQSIYRWRNGDWHILHDGIASRFGRDTDIRTLNTNYRSAVNIVDFNNNIYEYIPRSVDAVLSRRLKNMPLRFQDVYDTEAVVQKTESTVGGYVRCKFIEASSGSTNIRSLEDCSLDDMVAELQRLRSINGDYGGIAVLGRKKGELVKVAEKLLAAEPEPIPFCSSEALSVADNEAVRFIVAILRYSIRPYEPLYRAELLVCYKNLFYKGQSCITADDFQVLHNQNTSEFVVSDWERKLFADYTATIDAVNGEEDFLNRFSELKYLPLQRAVDNIITLFGLNGMELPDHGVNKPFIRCFIDAVHDYCIDHTSDIYTFLDYWDENGERIYVPIPETPDSVLLCTIHKSKGLEFDTVFLPFVNFKMGISTKNNNFIFCDYPRSVAGNGLVPFVPVNLKQAKSLMYTEFAQDVFSEFMDCCLDELNVLYVATTRAKRQLYINAIVDCDDAKTGDCGSDDGSAASFISDLSMAGMLKAAMSCRYGAESALDIHESSDGEIQCQVYEIGTLSERANDGVEKSKPLYDDQNDMLFQKDDISIDIKDTRLSLRFTNAVNKQDDNSIKARENGIVMHRIFEQMQRMSDIPLILQRVRADGLLDDGRYEEIRDICERLMNNENVIQLFDNDYNIVNEAEIWNPKDKSFHRPDRLMFDDRHHEAMVVDYKFGERTDSNDARYSRQVNDYMRLIADMGYKVKGYILYAFKCELVEVNL